MAVFLAEEIYGVTAAFPEEMSLEEATGYVIHCKEKYGNDNVIGVEIKTMYDKAFLYVKLADRPTDIMKRPNMYLKE